MKKEFAIFLIRLLVFSLAAYSFYYAVLLKYIPPKFYFEKSSFILLFFFIATAVFHYGLLQSDKKNSRSTITYFMKATALKFLLYMMVMVAYALLHRDQTVPFISYFMVLYILFSVFEAITAYRHFRRKPAL